MNVTIEMKGMKELQSKLNDMEKKQMPFAIALALTRTAQGVKEEIKQKMPSFIDRPTQWTTNSLYIIPATKTKPIAEVGYKDKSSIRVTTTNKGQGTPAAYYLAPNVEGGKRNLKRFELALQRIGVLPKGMYIAPGSACPLDAYGNIPRTFIIQILSYMRAFGEQGYTANISDKRKAALAKGSKRRQGFEYFVSYGKGTWSGRQHLPPGIWKRIGFAQGSAIKPIMMFVKEPSYSKRFPFHNIAQNFIDKNLMDNFYKAFDEAIRTAK